MARFGGVLSGVVIAWQGFPFYARRCLRKFRTEHPDWNVVVVTSAFAKEGLAAAERECGTRILSVDSERETTHAALGLPVATHLLATSWSHRAYRDLARETKAAGGCVTVLADNSFRATPRQCAGALYFRAVLRPSFDDAWVPGRSGRRFMEWMGMPGPRVHDGLYAADGEVFHSPQATSEGRRGVVYAGQLIPRKRVLELWRLWKLVGADLPLSMIGDGELAAALVLEGAPLEPAKSPAALAERLAQASALILPSRVDHWGVVLHEAALAGCLLLATRNCGAAADLIDHGRNGYVMNGFSRRELDRALTWLRSLGPAEDARGRERSAELARQYSPASWSATLSRILARQAGEIDAARGRRA